MVTKTKSKKSVKSVKKEKPSKKKIEEEEVEENEGGASLDDAFADDEDVSYAESKPKKEKKKKDEEDDLDEELEEAEEEVEAVSNAVNGGESISNDYSIKASKPISKVKKGDKIKIDDKEYEVDSHYILIDHKTTKEMAIEIFDKFDKDYQLRYFDDQVESTMEFYELQEIMYIKKPFSKVEW